MFPRSLNIEEAVHVFTDASDKALAAVCNDKWCVIEFTGEHKWMAEKPIHWRELYAVLVALVTFSDQLCRKDVCFHVDNIVACYCINDAKSRDIECMKLIRALYFYVEMFKINYEAFYINTKDNISADALSRLEFGVFC